MKLILIAALTRDRVIGRGGTIPWHIPEDLKHFKQATTGHPVVMGRATYESIGRPLPNRRNIVLTSRHLPGVESYPTIPDVLTALGDEPRVFVIGGGSVYRQFLPLADMLMLTIVDQNIEGDAFFPEYEHLIGTSYRLVKKDDREGFSFVEYERV